MNFSTWSDYSVADKWKKMAGISSLVQEGEMPPWFYLPMHAEARLNDDEITELAAWADTGPADE